MTKEIKIMVGIAGLILGLGLVLFLKGNPAPHVPPEDVGRLIRADSRMTGDPDTKVVLVEFGDYQCPFCAKLHPIIQQVLAAYGSNPNFNFVYRHYPLSQHRHARLAAQAVEAAGRQGKFWEMHDLIFGNQNQWASHSNPLELFRDYAQGLGLDPERFQNDVSSSEIDDRIDLDVDDARALGVNSTPTLYLNGGKITAADFNGLKNAIDNALALPAQPR